MKSSVTTEVKRGADAAFSAALRRSPLRTCVGCRQTSPQGQLIRLVCSPSGHLMVDPHGKLPGRGAYLCPRRCCAKRALGGAALREVLRQQVISAPVDDLVAQMARTLRARAIACIHLARKAGRAVSGYTQVMRALAHGSVACVLIAEDVAPERRREYATRCVNSRIPSRSFLTKTELGALAGRDECGAIGILDTHLSERLMCYLEGMSRLAER
jgi:predicted RNA-binding protein YlxR (DUF448 family)/ribosomal protein L30E